MKTLKKYLVLAVLFFSIVSAQNVKAQGPAPDGGITLQTFYDQLAPYGQWVNYPNLGYVFIPSVAPGFTPYSTAGHWTYSDQYGWTWASDYPWGWAAFHYGRWNFDANYGWFWIPDLNWGPAWVAWRNCEGYYGWAPMPWGCNINVGFDGDCGIPAERWCFVPQEHLCEFNLGAFFVPRVHYRAFLDHSTIINRMDYDNGHHFGYFRGPDRVEVERYTHHPVTVVTVNAYRRPDNYNANYERHDDHVVNNVVVRQDEHANMQAQRQDNHANEQVQRQDNRAPSQMQNNHGNMGGGQVAHQNAAPQRAVEINNVPQRGHH